MRADRRADRPDRRADRRANARADKHSNARADKNSDARAESQTYASSNPRTDKVAYSTSLEPANSVSDTAAVTGAHDIVHANAASITRANDRRADRHTAALGSADPCSDDAETDDRAHRAAHDDEHITHNHWCGCGRWAPSCGGAPVGH